MKGAAQEKLKIQHKHKHLTKKISTRMTTKVF
jgi:hypothetical protein